MGGTLVITPPLEIQISNHPDSQKTNIKRIVFVFGQLERYHLNHASLELMIRHYDSIEGVDGATETVKNPTEKDIFYTRIAHNDDRVNAFTGVNVPQYLMDENENFILDGQGNKQENPDWAAAVPEYLYITNLPLVIDGNDLWIGQVGGIKVENMTEEGHSNALNTYYVNRFDANGLFGLELYD